MPNKVQDSMLAQVAVQNVDSALQGKGLQKVQEGQTPDVIVTAKWWAETADLL
jgi:hypothetical protein